MTGEPKISIIIPVFNRPELIIETLESVKTQTYSNWECIIVDDGSSDNTKKNILTYIQKEPRFILVDRPDHHKPGANGARNYGYNLAKGDFIQWLDSDDLLHPQYIQEQLNMLETNPEANWVVCDNLVFETDINNPVGRWFNSDITSHDPLRAYVQKKLGIHTSSPVFRKKFLEEVKVFSGLFKEDLRQSQEWELFSRILFYDRDYLVVNKKLLYLRKNLNSITGDYNKRESYIFQSQIKSLEYVFNFLKFNGLIDDKLKSFFINSGITILTRLIRTKQDKHLLKQCHEFIFNCLGNSPADRLYRLRFSFGKTMWKKIKRGHFILKHS
jgi:glycosyltransferase involved in cell wall biosynthesis